MTRLVYVPDRIIDHNGIADAATVYVYLSGTTTPITLYSDEALAVPMANPFTVDAGAAFPAIYYDSSVNIKLRIISSLDGSINEYDPYTPLSVNVSSVLLSVKTFGAKGDGVTNDGPAFVAAIAYLEAQDLNSGDIDVYGGSQRLYVPAGHYYMGTSTLDINHAFVMEGDGTHRAPAPAYGPTRLRWDNGVAGIRIQFPTTSGNDTVDGVTHKASGGFYLKNITLEGGYSNTSDSVSHAVISRCTTFLDDVLIRGWSGIGVRTWTGAVSAIGTFAGGTFSGNASVSRYIGVKVENCHTAFDTRGTDSNVITFMNCEAYQCRVRGFVDENAAGANTYIGCHATFNGFVGSTETTPIYTTVVSSSKLYGVIAGQEVAAATNAPSGTTDHNSYWYYLGAGTVSTSSPAWTNGMSGLTWGGDYVALPNCWNSLYINCYCEGGGNLGQLLNSLRSTVQGGTNIPYIYGGSRWFSNYDRLNLFQTGTCFLSLGTDGFFTGITANNPVTSVDYGQIQWHRGFGAIYSTEDSTGHTFGTGANLASQTVYATINSSGLNLTNSAKLYINSSLVIDASKNITAAAIAGTGSITSSGGGVGYATGAGGAVTQTTSRTTGVTLNKLSGAITLFSAAGSASWQTFTVTNSTVAATDTVRICQQSGTDLYQTHVTNVAAGSFKISFATTGGTTTEQPVFNFSVIKGVTS